MVTAVSSFKKTSLIEEQNGKPSLTKKKWPEPEQDPRLGILIMIKVFPQSSELTGMLLAAPYRQKLDVRCGASGDGRFDQESTLPKAEILAKP